jgi:translation initiation factor 2-alpha kinase 3
MSSESQETSADFSCNAPRDTNNEQSKVSAVESSSQLPNASTALARLANSDLHNLDPKDQEVLFYLSLIEGRCKTQAANSINRGRHHLDWVPDSHPEVVELSRHLFSKISQEFHKAGLLPDKFSGLNLEVVRSKYLTTFDSILQDYATQHAPDLFDRNTDRSISRSNIFSLSEGSSSLALSGALARRQQFTMAEAAQSPSGLHSFQLNLQGNGINERLQSRYKSEYKEGHLIGKGGFGSVYKVENILDEQSYAIKKIKIQGRHLSLMDEQGRVTKMLSELRTLAKLSHQNVVRYYAGWIEAVAARPAIRSNTSR